MSTTTITVESCMEDVLAAYPAAQRALMRRYHIGGCSHCGFSPQERLGDVLAKHGILNTQKVIEHIKDSQAQEEKLQIGAQELADWLQSDSPPRLIDVREAEEQETVRLEGALTATPALMEEMMASWPKDTPIVTYCHFGIRSLEAASYLLGHGFTCVRTLRGGIDAWAREVDPSLPRYS